MTSRFYARLKATLHPRLRGLHWQGERGTTVSPRRIGDIVAAALHRTHFEDRYLPEPF